MQHILSFHRKRKDINVNVRGCGACKVEIILSVDKASINGRPDYPSFTLELRFDLPRV